jgi:ferredoxin
LCRQIAPEIFARNEMGGYSYVKKQPSTPDEEERAKQAMDSCPVQAIGNDGA